MDPVLETQRLILRKPSADDFEGYALMLGDARVMKNFNSDPLDRAGSWRNLAMMMGHWSLRGTGLFSVFEKASGHWVGRVGPWQPEGWPVCEIGWSITPAFWRRGFASEAARVCLDYAFEVLGWPEVCHCIAPDNKASIGVAEKLGARFMKRVDSLPGIPPHPALIYGQTRTAWSRGSQGKT